MVVAHAVRGRKQPGEERRVRRKRERRNGDRLREVDRFRAKTLQRGRADANRVRAERVDRHEDDGAGWSRQRRLRTRCPERRRTMTQRRKVLKVLKVLRVLKVLKALAL